MRRSGKMANAADLSWNEERRKLNQEFIAITTIATFTTLLWIGLILDMFIEFLPLVFLTTGLVFLAEFMDKMGRGAIIRKRCYNILGWDWVAHFISSFVVSFIGFIVLSILVYTTTIALTPIGISVFVFIIGITAIVGWEVRELISEKLTGETILMTTGYFSGILDTVFDLVFGFFGTLSASLLAYNIVSLENLLLLAHSIIPL